MCKPATAFDAALKSIFQATKIKKKLVKNWKCSTQHSGLSLCRSQWTNVSCSEQLLAYAKTRKHFHLLSLLLVQIDRVQRNHSNGWRCNVSKWRRPQQKYGRKCSKPFTTISTIYTFQNVYNIYYLFTVVYILGYRLDFVGFIFVVVVVVAVNDFLSFCWAILSSKTGWKMPVQKITFKNILMVPFFSFFLSLPIQFHELKYLATQKYLLRVEVIFH